jgi:dihydrofolate reductase
MATRGYCRNSRLTLDVDFPLDKNVAVATASITQQCIKAGLLDEIHIDLVPVLLGAGIRLFDHLAASPIELESTKVIEAPGVTHLGFRIVK